jgi:hypothetical protein
LKGRDYVFVGKYIISFLLSSRIRRHKVKVRKKLRIDKLYERHRLLIYKKALEVSNRTGWNKDDLLSYGNELFMEAARRWDRKRTFSTYLSAWLMKMYGMNKKTYKVAYLGLYKDKKTVSADIDRLSERIDTLSEDARTMCLMALEKEGKPKHIKTELRAYCRENGIKRDRWYAIKEEIRDKVLCQ